MKRAILILLMAGQWSVATAQMDLDSLHAVWQDPQRPDTVRTTAYHFYIWEGYLFSDPDSALLLAEELLAFAAAHDLRGEMTATYYLQGTALMIQSNFARALHYFEKCLALSEALGARDKVAASMGSIGGIYHQLNHYPKALEYYQRTLASYEELGDVEGISVILANLGGIYHQQGNFEKALEYQQKSLALERQQGNTRSMATMLLNLGITYQQLDERELALDHCQQALDAFTELGDHRGQSHVLRELGRFYRKQGEFSKAIGFYLRSLALKTEMKDKLGMSISTRSIGDIHAEQGEHHKAVEYCEQALPLASEVGALRELKYVYQCLYKSHKALGREVEALRYLEQLRIIEDSLQVTETTRKLEQMEFTKQALADSIARAEEARMVQEVHQEEIRRKNRTRNYMALGGLGLLVMAGGLYSRARYMRRSRDIISRERDRSENLLLNILPAEIAEELKQKGEAAARDFDMVSILFTDFKGFTQASERMSAAELVEELNSCFKAFDAIVEKHGIEKIKTIGDAYMAAGGLPVPDANAARNTVLAGLDMQDFMKARKAERDAKGRPAFEMRVGIHTGPVVAGIVGVKKFQYDIWGDTVNTASRMESSGEVGQVNISEATYALVRSDASFTFTPRGKVHAKSKGELEMYFVEPSATLA